MNCLLLLMLLTSASACDKHNTVSIVSTTIASAADDVATTSSVVIYNDVLNDLIYNHFYSLYLGKSASKVYEGMYPANADTAVMNARKRKLTRVLLSNRINLCTIYLNKDAALERFDLKLEGDERFTSRVKHILTKYSNNLLEVTKALSVKEQGYKASDFQVKIAKVSSTDDTKRVYDRTSGFIKKNGECVIGLVSMSKIVLNREGDKGVLYYELLCGSKCGKGELVEIIKKDGRWKIVNAESCWIS